MYLSRLILNPRCNQVQRELADLYQLHRTLLRAFPERLPQSERVLFRVDVDRRTGVPTVLVQSQSQPDWSFLADRPDYLLRVPPPLENPAWKPYHPSVGVGQLLQFRLRANPTFRRNNKRLAWLREEDQRAWLDRQAERSGFRLLQLTVIPQGMATATKYDDSHRHNLRHFAVVFEGVLQVTEPDAFLVAIARGIGAGKAFGFGLLSVAPAR
ncbi:MAG: type I-E CRISPR-associated protein Cas6/Cse3/CasE [Armatimonadetes bacterium]|nr:type I-E CRISPR-associated protein Cas6/Cse3/CasE [Armatimonadota bacterium]